MVTFILFRAGRVSSFHREALFIVYTTTANCRRTCWPSQRRSSTLPTRGRSASVSGSAEPRRQPCPAYLPVAVTHSRRFRDLGPHVGAGEIDVPDDRGPAPASKLSLGRGALDLVGTAIGIITVGASSWLRRPTTFFTFVFFAFPCVLGGGDPEGRRGHQLQRLAARRCRLPAVADRPRRPGGGRTGLSRIAGGRPMGAGDRRHRWRRWDAVLIDRSATQRA